MIIKNDFNIEDIVYLKSDPEQLPRFVTAIVVYKATILKYELTCGVDITEHWAFEISDDRIL
jgi:hypothetical protein